MICRTCFEAPAMTGNNECAPCIGRGWFFAIFGAVCGIVGIVALTLWTAL